MIGTRERIIADERYHTCGRCKWEELSDDMYPCNQCVHGTDTRKDFWEYAEKNESSRQPVEFKEEGCEDRAEIYPICPNCKEYLDNEKWSFCPYCGTPIEWT